ncbi:EutN/CcmL family microcompartment protein [Alkalispirochaeta alkalica]|uniref:EutN/CcmL family microcompartment protein n=1 Tax=Alkalispirochaeta alkalica TaxID=46356 RepID=UPI00036EF0B8|nr:EutN/CcmL family microcompartment protein [Alkalispirochaeta alkalica]
MNLARVTGTVVATQKSEALVGAKLLVLERLNERLKPLGEYTVAVDAVGAGEEEIVLYTSGSSARQTSQTKDSPVDAVIVAIVDSCTIGNETVFQR